MRDPERKARLARAGGDQEHIRQAPLFLVWLADLARLERVAGQVGEACAGLDYLEMFEVGVIDAALAAQNAVAAAESLGLGTVYIGAMRNHPEAVAAELALPPRVTAVFGLCVGTPDPRPRQRQTRAPSRWCCTTKPIRCPPRTPASPLRRSHARLLRRPGHEGARHRSNHSGQAHP